MKKNIKQQCPICKGLFTRGKVSEHSRTKRHRFKITKIVSISKGIFIIPINN